MNYFEFFDLPVTPHIDEGELKRRFYENSKKYHPDFYTLESAEKQAEILELSTLNNEAYRILADFDRRLKYLLELKGVLAEEGKNEIPQDFLLEMMEINEGLMELEFDFDKEEYQRILQRIAHIESALHQAIEPVIVHYNDKNSSEQELFDLRDFYLKRRYLLRLRENLDKLASDS